ncbi:MAG: glycosyltransferase [Leptolyngbya sp. PLA1]|nr:glycosyltransferase [Leptolyngbya sp. PLA1]
MPPRPAPPPPPILPPGTVVTQATVRAQIAGAARPRSVPLYVFDPESPEWAPLDNDATGEPEGQMGTGPFATRRAAMIGALSACDRVLAVSSFVERKFTALGVRADVLKRQAIGSRMVEIAAGQPEVLDRAPRPASPPSLSLVFLGYHNYPKGLHMLLDSLELLTPEHLAPIHLRVHAKDVEQAMPRLERLRGRLGSLLVSGGYAYEQVPALVAGADLGVVPSVWWDNGPQTVMEFLACGVPVLGAALGGIPDLVEHDRNGLLFRGNDRFDLARTLAALPWQRARLDRLRAGVRAPLSLAEHASQMLDLYASLQREHLRP